MFHKAVDKNLLFLHANVGVYKISQSLVDTTFIALQKMFLHLVLF